MGRFLLSVTERDWDAKSFCLEEPLGLLAGIKIKGCGLLGTSQISVPGIVLFSSRRSQPGVSVFVTLGTMRSWNRAAGAGDAAQHPTVSGRPPQGVTRLRCQHC